MEPIEEYWKFVESERHFNTIQTGIRNRASTWMLAAFAAIAVLIKTSKDTTWLVPSAVLVGLVSFMATIGLLVLWINDQLVYQRLLNSVFIIGLKWEYDNPKMPPIRTMMMCSAEGKGMSRLMTYYYTIPMVFFLGISIFVTILREHIGTSSKALTPVSSFWILVIICIVQAYLSIWVQRKKSKVTTQERAGYFGDEKFSAMFSGAKEGLHEFQKVIERYVPDTEGNKDKLERE
ncbi:MAG: hypothetical protein GWN67_06300 [Phycisphaerae bacterium]|nr:hypothetical protein [Phycisphaerae bacterium]NIR62564.1 hypothetical protein [candidate division Zixibacteria bacterium]NIP51569.1 hypothetical protein [Phycisphaerae bacterium]NIS50719.1 hypothetical protein [Phycisphaerae bacterium]NIU08479.1 hypothetical protein [Phycisphaerae bacterium]